MPAVLRISGFPATLPAEEMRNLLETVGSLEVFEVEKGEEEEEEQRSSSPRSATVSCRVQYKDSETTEKAREGFHNLKMNDVVLTVSNADAKDDEGKTKSRDGPRRKVRENKDERDRDRDREKSSRRRRSRSRSRSKSRSRSRSGSRGRRHRERRRDGSEERSERRKKSRFAPPPAAPDVMAAMGLSALPPTVAAGLAAQGITSLPLPAASMALPGASGPVKTQLELFVGNTPPSCTQQGLPDFLNAAMRQVGLAKGPGDPIIAARLSNKFAFVTFRSVEECTLALGMNGIPFLGNNLKIQRPSSYRGPPDNAVTWQVLTGQATPDSIPPPLDPNTKTRRELFVGNMPPEAQGSVIRDFLGNAMTQVGLTTGAGNPIVNVRMNSRFSFLEFRSVEECTNALNLNNIPFMGASLNLARPAKYDGPQTPHKSWFDMLAAAPGFGATAALPAGPTETATSCIKIGNVVDEDELVNDDDYKEVLDDMKEECSKYGPITEVIIPRGTEPGKGFVFVSYSLVEDAAKAKITFGARTFDGKPVHTSFVSKEAFDAREFG